MQGARGGGTHAVVRGYAPIWNRGERVSVSSEFGRRAADDELCAAVAKAVADGDSDALRRLGLDGWGDYVQRLSELMNESVRDELDYSPDFGALMSQVASPARYAHHLVTESGTAVQKAKDTPLGIHIKPLEPEFDDDALKGTVGTAASMDDPERAVETLADGLAYAVKKAGNDFVQANAEQRSRAGFEVGVKRSGSTKCCPWCAARIGSWALKNAPDGVFGCHAKCSCVVEYTSSTGAVSQRRGTGRFVEVEYQPPHVMTHEEAKEKGGFDEPKRLTGGGNGGIIGSGGNGGNPPNNPGNFKEPSEEYKAIVNAFTNMTNSDDIVDTVVNNHFGLAEFTPQTMKDLLESAGYETKPLNKSATWKGIPFEQGGGYKTNFGGDAYFQYHPEKGSHHDGAYWRIANGKHGDKRYKMDGTEQNK